MVVEHIIEDLEDLVAASEAEGDTPAVIVCHNPSWADGQSTSLRVGLDAAGRLGAASERPLEGVESGVEVAPDASDFRVVYDPGHPDADEQGYVLMPNVNPISEMVDMITASRAYEANVSAVQTAKDMFNDALKI